MATVMNLFIMPEFYMLKQLCCICYNYDMNYSIATDIQTVCSLLDLTPSSLSEYLGVHRSTVSRILSGQVIAGELFIQRFYSFAYDNPIRRLRLN